MELYPRCSEEPPMPFRHPKIIFIGYDNHTPEERGARCYNCGCEMGWHYGCGDECWNGNPEKHYEEHSPEEARKFLARVRKCKIKFTTVML
jgi:hypothetical protein